MLYQLGVLFALVVSRSTSLRARSPCNKISKLAGPFSLKHFPTQKATMQSNPIQPLTCWFTIINLQQTSISLHFIYIYFDVTPITNLMNQPYPIHLSNAIMYKYKSQDRGSIWLPDAWPIVRLHCPPHLCQTVLVSYPATHNLSSI